MMSKFTSIFSIILLFNGITCGLEESNDGFVEFDLVLEFACKMIKSPPEVEVLIAREGVLRICNSLSFF